MYALYPKQRAEGEVLIGGRDILGANVDVADLRYRVGMVFQKPTPFPMSVFENVAFGLRLAGSLSGADLKARVESALRDAAIWDEVKDKLRADGRSLSGGQQQRLCIARTIAVQPEVLLLDEPTAGMGSEDVVRITQLIGRVAAGRTVVLVEHNLSVVADLSQRITVLQRGKVLVQGTYAEVRSDQRVIDAYLGGGASKHA
jgi:phosphate transport system ATP-binding protein